LTINWIVSPRIVEVIDSPLSVQDLYDTLRNKAAVGEAMDDDEIIDGSGKDDLGEGVLVGLTVKLLNAKVKFEARASPTICTIRGGNLIAVDENGDSMTPIEPSTNVSVVISQSTSASLIEGTGADSAEIADAVWDEIVGDHLFTDSFGALVDFIRHVEGGRWLIDEDTKQMIFYDATGNNEIARFNLYDATGQLTVKDVFERVRV